MSYINQNISQIRDICKKHKVSRLLVFGSVLSDNFDESSDIDFLVDFKGVDLIDDTDKYFNLKTSPEKLLKKRIDLLEDKALSNLYLLNSINTSKKMIYG